MSLVSWKQTKKDLIHQKLSNLKSKTSWLRLKVIIPPVFLTIKTIASSSLVVTLGIGISILTGLFNPKIQSKGYKIYLFGAEHFIMPRDEQLNNTES